MTVLIQPNPATWNAPNAPILPRHATSETPPTGSAVPATPATPTAPTAAAVEGAKAAQADPVPVLPGAPRTMDVNASEWRPSARLGDNLKKYGTDLTEAAAAGQLRPAFGRSRELEQIVEILGRPTNNNPVLLGESGVGKTALFEELARRIVAGEVPEHMQNRRMVLIDLNAMTAGTQYRGDFEARLDGVIKEIEGSNGMIIPVIDEIHMLKDAGSARDTGGAGDAIKPVLARGKLRLIGATTPREYDEKVRVDAALHRRFSQVTINEPDAKMTLEILQGSAPFLEGKSGLRFTNDALKAVQEMSTRYVVDRFQPAKAIEVASQTIGRMTMLRNSPPREVTDMREKVITLTNEYKVLSRETSPISKEKAAEVQARLGKVQSDLDTTMTMWQQAAKLARGENPGSGADIEKIKARFPEMFRVEILREDVARTISDRTGIPVGAVGSNEKEKLLKLEENLNKQVIGQSEALSHIASAIRRGRTGVADPGRPVANILMIGPPGVGKTETAKATARVLFENPEALTRFNMGEYGTPGSRERLVNDISDAMRKRPYAVMLLDEIEKGHPSVYDALMTALGEGRLKDSYGRTADLSNSVVLLASNMLKDDLPNFFRPEFIDRMDEIVEYAPLDKPSLAKIADIQIGQMAQQVAADLKLDVSSAARDKLVDLGYKPDSGARNLKRVIQRTIGDAIANSRLNGELKPGMGMKVDVDADGNLTFTPVAAGA